MLTNWISAPELAEWMAFDRFQPFGAERGDLQAGIGAAAMINMWGKNANAKPGDFLLRFRHEPGPAQSAAELRSTLEAWTKSFDR